jgi:hypothetical protein
MTADRVLRSPAMRRLIFILILMAAPIASAREVLPFIENDYAKALARAKTKNVPLFVDAWAPW